MQRRIKSRRHWDNRIWQVERRHRSIEAARTTARLLRRHGFLARVVRLKAKTIQGEHFPLEFIVYVSRRGKAGVRGPAYRAD